MLPLAPRPGTGLTLLSEANAVFLFGGCSLLKGHLRRFGTFSTSFASGSRTQFLKEVSVHLNCGHQTGALNWACP